MAQTYSVTSGDGALGPSTTTGRAGDVAIPADYATAILAHSPYAHLIIARDGQILHANRATEAITGRRVTNLIGTNALDHVHPDDFDLAIRALEEIGPGVDDRDEGIPILLRVLRADGTTTVVETGAINQLDTGLDALCMRLRPYDNWMHLESFIARLAQPPTDEIDLSDLVGYLDTIIPDAQASIGLGWTGDTFSSLHSRALPADLRTAQLAPDPTADTPWARALAAGELVEAEVSSLPRPIARAATAAGVRTCWAHPIPGAPGHHPTDALVVWRQRASTIKVGHREALRRAAKASVIARQRQREHQALVRAARLDPLTGLANRSRFFATLARVARVPTGDAPLLYLDLDDFKVINDTWGHGYGDRVLWAVADAIATITERITDRELISGSGGGPDDADRPAPGDARPGGDHQPSWLVARLGGDEFAVLGPASSSRATAEHLADALVGDIDIADHGVDGLRVGLSAGLALVPPGGCDPDTLLEAADAGLYAAKRAGRGTWAETVI